MEEKNIHGIEEAVKKMMLMQAHSFFIGGIPMLFYGDEAGYTNDYSYLKDTTKNYDNRWMHRPVIDWQKNKLIDEEGTVEYKLFKATKQLIQLRAKLAVLADYNNLVWFKPHNIHVAGYLRARGETRLYCLFNFSNKAAHLSWYAFKELGYTPHVLFDHWNKTNHTVGADHEYLVIPAYSFFLLEEVNIAETV